MKKKIIIGLSVFSLIFFVAGIYIIITIKTTTSKLDNLIKLHQVEILREHLLIQIARIQSDLKSEIRDNNAILSNINNLGRVAEVCFSCHHSENIKKRLIHLRDNIQGYQESVKKAIAENNVEASLKGVDAAFRKGEDLIADVNDMITITSTRLDKRTRLAMKKIEDKKTMLFIALAIGPILATTLMFILIKSLTNPINTLLNATRRLKSGDLDYRVTGLKDEFGEVALSLNEMAGSLKEQILNMQRTEQLRACGEMATGLAHEIKNPLAGIKVSMEVLAEDSSIGKEDREVLLKVVDEVRRIEALLKRLLTFAKPPAPQFSPTNINNIIDISLAFSVNIPSRPPNNSKGIKILKEFDNNLPIIMADQMQLQQVFLNLFLNAVDAMPNGGVLTIKTFYKTGTNSIIIEIADTGKGIPEEMIGKMFQPFFTTKTKGTGMGLAISRRIIEEHGGSIGVESKQGKGTTFRIGFPVKIKP